MFSYPNSIVAVFKIVMRNDADHKIVIVACQDQILDLMVVGHYYSIMVFVAVAHCDYCIYHFAQNVAPWLQHS